MSPTSLWPNDISFSCPSRKNLNKDIQVYDGVLTTVDDKTGIVFKAEVSDNKFSKLNIGHILWFRNYCSRDADN